MSHYLDAGSCEEESDVLKSKGFKKHDSFTLAQGHTLSAMWSEDNRWRRESLDVRKKSFNVPCVDGFAVPCRFEQRLGIHMKEDFKYSPSENIMGLESIIKETKPDQVHLIPRGQHMSQVFGQRHSSNHRRDEWVLVYLHNESDIPSEMQFCKKVKENAKLGDSFQGRYLGDKSSQVAISQVHMKRQQDALKQRKQVEGIPITRGIRWSTSAKSVVANGSFGAYIMRDVEDPNDLSGVKAVLARRKVCGDVNQMNYFNNYKPYWCLAPQDNRAYVEIDLGNNKWITAIGTKGKPMPKLTHFQMQRLNLSEDSPIFQPAFVRRYRVLVKKDQSNTRTSTPVVMQTRKMPRSKPKKKRKKTGRRY
jgi:hypothetical protein